MYWLHGSLNHLRETGELLRGTVELATDRMSIDGDMRRLFRSQLSTVQGFNT